jgi:PadR family transcriptional regulator PadR
MTPRPGANTVRAALGHGEKSRERAPRLRPPRPSCKEYTYICLLIEGPAAPILAAMRRKPGALLRIEVDILLAGVSLIRNGEGEFHGYAVAREIANLEGARRLTAHGTLYRALERLEARGLLASRWEDPQVAAMEDRPRRRLYRVTAEGEAAVQVAGATASFGSEALKRRLAPS